MKYQNEFCPEPEWGAGEVAPAAPGAAETRAAERRGDERKPESAAERLSCRRREHGEAAPGLPSAEARPFQPTPPMLVNEISRLFHSRMRAEELEGVMSQDSARLLMRALSHEDGVSQLQLTKITHLKPPTVSVTLRRMEEEGLIQRRQDTFDLRMTRVYLSARGVAHNKRIVARLRSTDAILMQGFSSEEGEQLLGYLQRMRDNILSAQKENHAEQ